MKAYLELARPMNVLFGVAGALVGALVAAGPDLPEHAWDLLGGCIVVSSFMTAGNALNDLTDREIDRKNHPDRPLPSGRASTRGAMTLVLLMWAICLGVSLTLPPLAILVALTAAFLMVAYDLGLKRAGFAGTVTISLLGGMLFLFGGAVVDEPLSTLVLFLLAFLATVAREVVKDIEDIRGDTDRDTLPKTMGVPRARAVVTAAVVAAVVLSPVPLLLDLLHPAYAYVVVAADAMFLFSLSALGDPRRASLLLKSSMAVGLTAFIAGGVMT